MKAPDLACQQPPERQRVRLDLVVQEALELSRIRCGWPRSRSCASAHHALRAQAPPREIRIASRTEGGSVVLEVADNGPGMAHAGVAGRSA